MVVKVVEAARCPRLASREGVVGRGRRRGNSAASDPAGAAPGAHARPPAARR